MNKIKILHIVYSFEVGGVESLLLSLLNGLNKSKYEISLLSLTSDKLSLTSSLNNDINIYSLNLTEKNKKNLYSLSFIVNQLRVLINKIRPDIIHNHLTAGSFLLTSIALKLANNNILHIKTVHTTGSFYSNKKLMDKTRILIEKQALKMNKTNIIAVSESVRQINLRYFKDVVNDLQLIPNGIDLTKFDADNYGDVSKDKFGFDNKKIIITYVARLEQGKNHLFLINIWSEVLKQVPHAQLCFAGDGSLKEDLIKKVNKNQLQNDILFLGSVTDIPELLSLTDIAVFPSTFEGFGLVLLEYFAMKIPTIASNIEAFNEIAVDKESAFLVSLQDDKRFIQCIIELCNDEELRKKIGINANKVAQNYSIDKTISNYDNYYSRCLKKATET